MKKKKLMIIGLDGATWKILRPLVDAGKLPNIRKIMNGGVYGYLQSTFPPVTTPAWICMATGKNPGKIGVFDFISKDKNDSWKVTNSNDFRKNNSYWDLLNRHNYITYLINYPTLYPFYDINGVIVGGLALPPHANKTYPTALETKLDEITDGYLIEPNHFWENKDEFVVDLIELIEKQSKAVHYLLDQKWDLFFHVSSVSDWLQHGLWSDWEDIDSKYHQDFINIWVLLDKKIGSILEKISNINLLIVSDHGFGSLKENFNLSRWLYEKGYVNKKRFARLRRFTHFILYFSFKKLKKIIPEKYLKLNKITSGVWQKQLNIGLPGPPEIDMEKSRIIPGHSSGQQGYLYINKSVKNREELKRELMDELKKAGEKYEFNINVYETDELFSGNKIHLAPDIIFKINDFRCNIQISTLKGKIFSDVIPSKNKSGSHRMKGIFMAYGPDIINGGELKELKIYDIAPTILHMFDVPIPKDIDGRVLKEIFRQDSEFAKKEVEYEKFDMYENKLKIKIKNLKLKGKI